ncbi:WHG domain-containing protein [Salipaludibacillus sp. HK11]|uniref:TetR/AcrR family transcriptional regulator n=1 Tax=Salipaludibacillus sp. HK11 TaxID=3394320 RepID=UPI0039FDDAB6
MARKGLDIPIILRKATQLIDENGLDQISIGSLAKELEVRPPSLYNHLKGLDELKQRLAVYGVEKLYDYMVEAAVGRSKDDAVRALSKAYVRFGHEHPGLYEATFRAPNRSDSELQQAQEAVVQLIVRVFESYGLKGEMALHTVRGLRSLLHGFISIEQMDGFGLPLDLDESFSIIIDTYLEGIDSIAKREGR